MNLLRISKSLIHFVTVVSMVMPSVALIASSDQAWADGANSCQKLIDDCNKAKDDALTNDPTSACSYGNVGDDSSDNVCAGGVLQGDNATNCAQHVSSAYDACKALQDKCSTECKPPKVKPDQTDKCKQSLQAVMDGLSAIKTNMLGIVKGDSSVTAGSCVKMNDAKDMDVAGSGGGGAGGGGDDSTTKPGGGGGGGGAGGGGAGAGGAGSGGRSAGGGAGGGAGNMMSSLLPLAAMAAMMAAQQKKNNQQQQQGSANGYASPDGVVDASGKVNCGATYAYRYSYCNTQVSQACMANITTMASSQVCEQFSARYCNQGYSAPSFYSSCPYPYTAGETCGTSYFTTPSPTQATQVDIIGEGTGSAYCLRATQIQFCSVASNAQCPSCLQLQSLQSTACVNNPALCNVVNSSTSTATQVAACPATDPLVAAGLISGATAVATNTITTTTTNTPGTAPPAVLPLASASTASANGLQVASAINGINARSPSSVGDVAPEYGTSLFNAGSTPLSQRCSAGLFNHCIRN